MQFLFWWLLIGWVVALVDIFDAKRRNRGNAAYQRSLSRWMLVIMVVEAVVWPLTLMGMIVMFVADYRERVLNKNSN